MSLGPDFGMMQVNGMFKSGPGLSRDKITYMDKNQAMYRDGNLPEFKKTVKIIRFINNVTKCCGCCCPCVSMGISHTRTIKTLNPKKSDISAVAKNNNKNAV